MALKQAKKPIGQKLLKIFLPVFAGLALPVIIYITYMSYHPLEAVRDGNSAVFGFWILNNIIFPVLTLILLLIQWLIILPWWNRVIIDKKVKAALILAAVSLFISALLGFATWTAAFGLTRLVLAVSFLFVVQLFYWLVNIIVLYFLDKPHISKIKQTRR